VDKVYQFECIPLGITFDNINALDNDGVKNFINDNPLYLYLQRIDNLIYKIIYGDITNYNYNNKLKLYKEILRLKERYKDFKDCLPNNNIIGWLDKLLTSIDLLNVSINLSKYPYFNTCHKIKYCIIHNLHMIEVDEYRSFLTIEEISETESLKPYGFINSSYRIINKNLDGILVVSYFESTPIETNIMFLKCKADAKSMEILDTFDAAKYNGWHPLKKYIV